MANLLSFYKKIIRYSEKKKIVGRKRLIFVNGDEENMITLKKLFSLPELEPIRLVAGKNGINRLINGVNVMESDRLVEFFKENELLVTTGINMGGDERKLNALVNMAFNRKAAGIILNVGPYIPSIPEPVFQFADEHRFPVFEMPWAYRIADFVKITVQYLTAAGQGQTKTECLLSEILFDPETDRRLLGKELSQLGIEADAHFSIIVGTAGSVSDVSSRLLHMIENELSKGYKILLSMVHRDQIIYMADRTEIQISAPPLSKLIQSIRGKYGGKSEKTDLFIGAGSDYSVKNLSESYDEAMAVIHLARHYPDLLICEYKDVGAYKIIMNVRDRNVVETFHQETLGLLYGYDKLHETDFVHFLRVFLEEDGHTANIARKEFVHRNTVLYKTKKIESILGVDLYHPFVKMNLSLAFMIENVMR